MSRRALVTKHVQDCGRKTIEQLQWLQELERRPRTMNDHYYSDYKDKFLALYRGSRQTSNNGSVVKTITKFANHPSSLKRNSPEIAESTTKALSSLAEIGLNIKAPELLKLLPPDPWEPALSIMATVRAYFQGKHHVAHSQPLV